MKIVMEQLSNAASPLLLSVMVPARNEEDVLKDCLDSLIVQSLPEFQLGRDWELLIVDDHSTDSTRAIAMQTAGAHLLDPDPLQPGWTGKANALWTAAKVSHGNWLLFTDADTVHEPGSLQRAIAEAETTGVSLLSYSPSQVVTGFMQRALMPLVFSELANAYPPQKVSDPASPLAAANGQFLMIERKIYFAFGGHGAVAGSLLEDVDLARIVKSRGLPIRFRYAPDALLAKMYRTNRAMLEGWTRNLTRLFPRPLQLAAARAIEFFLLLALPVLSFDSMLPVPMRLGMAVVWVYMLARFFSRVAKSNFPVRDRFISIVGLPLFSWLLVRSWFSYTVKKQVSWKGRLQSADK